MLVFGAVELKAANDGGIEITHNGTHQWLSREEVNELSNWLSWNAQRVVPYINPTTSRYQAGLQAAAQVQADVPPGMIAQGNF